MTLHIYGEKYFFSKVFFGVLSCYVKALGDACYVGWMGKDFNCERVGKLYCCFTVADPSGWIGCKHKVHNREV